MRDKILLRQLQSLPLRAKVLMTQQRIREWYNYFDGQVCISFSGGKDSTVLAHLVHDLYPEVPMVFANTGLEYPEIQKFAREMGAEFVRPKMQFSEVISTYGYPIISKEVAEAIHFARRIVPKNPESLDFVERERERERESTRLPGGTGRNWTGKETTRQRSSLANPYTHTHTHTQIPHGRTGWRRANLTDSLPDWTTDSKNQQEQHTGYKSTECGRIGTTDLPEERPTRKSNNKQSKRTPPNPASQTAVPGERLTGTGGEENPLPG